MPEMPSALNTDQKFYAHQGELLGRAVDLLCAQNAILGEIRDRLGQTNDATPPAADPHGPAPVESREPAADHADGPQEIDLREPDPAAPNLKARRRRTAAKRGT